MKKAKILLIYSGVDGQTQAIATKIGTYLVSQYDCTLYDIAHIPVLDLSRYDLIVLGAAIRYGFFARPFTQFVANNATMLNQLPSVFFSVTLTARKATKCTPQTNSYTRKFLNKTPWKPRLCGVFAGALHYPRYAWYDRFMIQMIMRLTGGETDATKDVEFTDWQAVAEFAAEISQMVNYS